MTLECIIFYSAQFKAILNYTKTNLSIKTISEVTVLNRNQLKRCGNSNNDIKTVFSIKGE